MSTTKHTPGPWFVSPIYKREIRTKEVNGNATKVCIAVNNPTIGDAEGDANAVLIAAAPELLAQLKEMIRWYWEGYDAKGIRKLLPDTKGPSKKAIALIEKATGEKLEDFL